MSGNHNRINIRKRRDRGTDGYCFTLSIKDETSVTPETLFAYAWLFVIRWWRNDDQRRFIGRRIALVIGDYCALMSCLCQSGRDESDQQVKRPRTLIDRTTRRIIRCSSSSKNKPKYVSKHPIGKQHFNNQDHDNETVLSSKCLFFPCILSDPPQIIRPSGWLCARYKCLYSIVTAAMWYSLLIC